MYLVTLTYGHPTDPAAFDKHYQDEHLPLASKIPGVQAFAGGKCESLDGQPAAAYLQAVLTFADRETAGAALGSAEGQAAAADIATFATGGATMTFTQVDVSIP
ncbi:EthD protein [Pseudonocardia autotrophica]|nr:EthD protein [Pseudonocardia autotrophica]